MAKKATKKAKKNSSKEMPENMLPQNILPIGERVEENKNIYISQPVYKAIHRFTKNKTTDESGGMLIGNIIAEFGKTNIVISDFIEAKYCEGTPTTLKFTHETWEYVHKEMEKKHKGKKIVGWIHTHPDFGIFLSEYDKFIHQNFFNEDHQVAYVVDPIQKIEGFYFWINHNLEKCKGFYIYDKTGTKITVNPGKDEPADEANNSLFSAKNILIAVLSVIVVFLIFANISTNKALERVKSQQEELIIQQQALASETNQALYYMQQILYNQQAEIQELRDILTDAGILVVPEDHTVSENTPHAETAAPDQNTIDIPQDPQPGETT